MFTRFGDRIETAPAEQDRFAASGRYASAVPLDGSNLVLLARDALRRHAGGQNGPVSISLEKNLPVAAGIGGGSSDAAATLRGLAKLWGLDASDRDLAGVGAPLGADLPMCLAAQPLTARGTGDELSIVSGFPPLALVLVNPGVAVSTAAVFSALARRDNEELPPLPRRIDFHSLRNWLETTRNDLEPPALALVPAIVAAKAALGEGRRGCARMSGSGATCFGLFETGNVAKRAAVAIRGRHPDWFVAATRSMASEAEIYGQD